MRSGFLFFFLLHASVALSDSELRLDPFVVPLPEDLQILPDDEASKDAVNLIWKRELDSQEIAKLRQSSKDWQFEEFEAEISSGNTGSIILTVERLNLNLSQMEAEEQHQQYCEEFRKHWGYGFSQFDEDRQIGHCASPVGAMTYVMCRYFERNRICASGIDYIQLLFTDETFRTHIIDDMTGFSTKTTAQKVLERMAPLAAVEKINDLLIHVRLLTTSDE